MTTLITILHVLICLFLIAVVLLQSGRAGGMGVLSGAATQTVFGGRGAGSFLQKLTAVCAILFMVTCSVLAFLASSTRDRALGNTAGTNAAPARPANRPAASSPAEPASGLPASGASPARPAPPTPAPAPMPPTPTQQPTPSPSP
jgi:preprotein translocase subunit SecG